MTNGVPRTAADYDDGSRLLMTRCLLHVATVLGDLMTDDMTVVGGLVPSLLIPPEALPPGADAHPGTLDLDLGLRVALLANERYREVADRLRAAGFTTDVNEAGNPTHQRWRRESAQNEVARVEFLMEPLSPDAAPGTTQHLEHELAAFVAPGIGMSFDDRIVQRIVGRTLDDETAERDVGVCGPGAFVALKALAFDGRGYRKDAYDLYYVLRNYRAGPADVARRFALVAPRPEGTEALEILRRDFMDPEAVGPRRAAAFATGGVDEAVQVEVVGFVAEFLRLVEGG